MCHGDAGDNTIHFRDVLLLDAVMMMHIGGKMDDETVQFMFHQCLSSAGCSCENLTTMYIYISLN